MTETGGDTRADRTRRKIVEAFNCLVLDRSGEAIRVADVVEAAGVGRSTFYEHFRNIDDLHTDAALWLLTHIADAVPAEGDARWLAFVLEHLRENRRMARATLSGGAAGPYARRLSELIGERLATERPEADTERVRLASVTASEATLAMVRVWLDETAPGDAAAYAHAVREAVRAGVEAFVSMPAE